MASLSGSKSTSESLVWSTSLEVLGCRLPVIQIDPCAEPEGTSLATISSFVSLISPSYGVKGAPVVDIDLVGYWGNARNGRIPQPTEYVTVIGMLSIHDKEEKMVVSSNAAETEVHTKKEWMTTTQFDETFRQTMPLRLRVNMRVLTSKWSSAEGEEREFKGHGATYFCRRVLPWTIAVQVPSAKQNARYKDLKAPRTGETYSVRGYVKAVHFPTKTLQLAMEEIDTPPLRTASIISTPTPSPSSSRKATFARLLEEGGSASQDGEGSEAMEGDGSPSQKKQKSTT